MVSLGVRRSEFRKPVGEGFAYPARLSPMLIQPSAEGVPGLFPGSKAAGECVVHPPPSSAEFKERVKLCTSSTPPLDHHGLLQGAINLYLTFIWLVYWISIIQDFISVVSVRLIYIFSNGSENSLIFITLDVNTTVRAAWHIFAPSIRRCKFVQRFYYRSSIYIEHDFDLRISWLSFYGVIKLVYWRT